MALDKLTSNVKVDNAKKILYVDFDKMNDADKNVLSIPIYSNGDWTIKPMPKKRKSNRRYKKESEYKKVLSASDAKQFDKIKMTNGYFAAANWAENRI